MVFRILTGKKTPSYKTSAIKKKTPTFASWYIKSTLFKRSPNWNEISEKIKLSLAKLCSLWYVHFVLPILFTLTLASNREVLYGNAMFSVVALSAKKLYSSFLEKVLVFQEICFKSKVLKMFKISSDFHIKTCWSLKRRDVSKIPITLFRTYALSVGSKIKHLRKKCFSVSKKLTQILL